MCNLYYMSPPDEFESYLRRHYGRVRLPLSMPEKRFVGPFDTGLFLRADGVDGLVGELGQWGLIRPGAPTRKDLVKPKTVPGKKTPAPRPRSTNNARVETVGTLPTFRAAWNESRRCLIPATWYQEPNWQTGKNIWWQLKRADGLPWMLAGIWNHWTDPDTGEIVPNYTMLTRNCDDHPFLARLHKPDPRKDKRAVVHIEPEDWSTWMNGSAEDARALLRLQPTAFFDQADAIRTDAFLTGKVAQATPRGEA